MKIPKPDADIINALGGPTKVARLLRLKPTGGTQRVQNWMTRGIPSHVKVAYPQLFMPELAAPQSHQEPQAIKTDSSAPLRPDVIRPAMRGPVAQPTPQEA